MTPSPSTSFRVAAINFLNPAPLMWDFEHPPLAATLAQRYSLHYTHPAFLPAAADAIAMLQQADAAILIGDPALLALESRKQIEATIGPCQWFDLAHEWHTRTGLPWVAAVWAVRPESLAASHITASQLIDDLTESRNHGL